MSNPSPSDEYLRRKLEQMLEGMTEKEFWARFGPSLRVSDERAAEIREEAKEWVEGKSTEELREMLIETFNNSTFFQMMKEAHTPRLYVTFRRPVTGADGDGSGGQQEAVFGPYLTTTLANGELTVERASSDGDDDEDDPSFVLATDVGDGWVVHDSLEEISPTYSRVEMGTFDHRPSNWAPKMVSDKPERPAP